MCPSSRDGVSINEILGEIVTKEIYKKDYDAITSYFQKTRIDYEKAIDVVKKIIAQRVF
jgi:hypothetical protein